MAGASYRPEIDGLRALAVLAVVLFHFGLNVPGGYVGVDVFFVISGYLITGIIIRGLEQSSFSLADFWERRLRRIFPPLIIMVIVALGLGYHLLPPQELEELGTSSVAQALLLANVYFWRDTGYFAGPADSKALLHTWSLAVEEQFYLFYPLLLLLFRHQSRRRLLGVMISLFVVSFVMSVYGTRFHSGATFYLLPTRAWELLTGGILAVLPSKRDSRRRRDEALAIAGFLAIILPVFFYDAQTPFPGLAALPPVIGTAAVIFATAATPHTKTGSVLSLRPLVFLGQISYSLYLWHWPAIVFARTYWGGALEWRHAALALAGTVVLSVLSWKFIETPFRQKVFLRSRRMLFATSFLMSGATIAISIVFVLTGGVPTRFPHYSPVLLEDTIWKGDTEFSVLLSDEFDPEAIPTLGVERTKNSNDDERPDFILWGDSHAQTMCGVINEIAADLKLAGKAIATGGVPPLPRLCIPSYDGIPARDVLARQEAVMKLMEARPPRNLLVVCRWSLYTDGWNEFETSGNSTGPLLLSDDPQGLSITDVPETVLSRNLEELASFCKKIGIKLWVLKQVPETGESQPAREFFLWSVGKRLQPSNNRRSVDQHQSRQAKVEKIFHREVFEDVRFIDPATQFFDDDGLTINYRDGRSCYRDDDHLTRWGLESMRPLLTGAMVEMKHQIQLELRGDLVP